MATEAHVGLRVRVAGVYVTAARWDALVKVLRAESLEGAACPLPPAKGS